jgi:hypothetical protein
MDVILRLLTYGPAMVWIWLIACAAKSLSKDHRDDPVYKKNVQDLIERYRQFENKE